MRKKAKKILFDALKQEGNEELLFSSGKLSDNSGAIDTIVDAMIEFHRKTQNDRRTRKSDQAKNRH